MGTIAMSQEWELIGMGCRQYKELLGETHWLKPPTLARHHSNHLHVILWQEVLVRNTELTSYYQPEFRKGQKQMSRVQPPPGILLAGIHLGWAMRWVPGRTPSQEWLARENPEVNPNTIKMEVASHVTEQSSWLPLPSCSPPRCPFSQ